LKPPDFSIFPSILLATTLFQLVLNIATTRLILTRIGSNGMFAAGKIEAICVSIGTTRFAGD